MPTRQAWRGTRRPAPASTANSSPALGPPTASFTVTSNDCLNYINVDVTALVRDWASGYLANDGLALVGSGSVNVVFDTKESRAPKEKRGTKAIEESRGRQAAAPPRSTAGWA